MKSVAGKTAFITGGALPSTPLAILTQASPLAQHTVASRTNSPSLLM